MKLIVLISFFLSHSSAFSKIVPVSVFGPQNEQIDGQFIVKFHSDARIQFNQFLQKQFTEQMSLYDFGDFMGFGAILSERELEVIQLLDGVEMIEPNTKMFAFGEQLDVKAWGIDRSDQTLLPLDEIYRWDDSADGTGSTVFILDTGIDTTHSQFEGRATFAADCVGFGECITDIDPGDGHGHGTHCAGTAVSKDFGIAKNAIVSSVRCLDSNGRGTTAGVVKAIEYVADLSGDSNIISMSLGGGFSQILNDAVDAAHKSGVVIVVAAGNSNSDACRGSPGSAPLALTVAASDITDRKASFSAFGSCVKVWAPGTNILSTLPNESTGLFSGTSMSTPHVAGAVALVLSRGQSQSPDQVLATILGEATANVIDNVPDGTPNRLLYTSP